MTFIDVQERLLWTKRPPFTHRLVMEAPSTGSVIRDGRKQKGMTQTQLGEAVGVRFAAVGQWERGVNDISPNNLRAVCRVLGIDVGAAMRGELVWMSDTGLDLLADVEQVTSPGRPNLGPRDVPVSGVVHGGDGPDEDFVFEGRVIDYVRRPPGIEHLQGVFALHVLSSSMWPRYSAGDIVYAGGRAPLPGDDVVIEFHPDNGHIAGKGLLKTLVRRGPRKVIVSQFNPSKEIELDAATIKQVTRVIPTKELLGF